MKNLIDSVKELLKAREIVNELMNKCERISQKLHNQMSNLIDKKSFAVDMDIALLKIKSQPKLLNPELIFIIRKQ